MTRTFPTSRTYHREVPAGLSVGRKDWTVSCVSNIPVDQALIRLEEKFDSQFQPVNQKLQTVNKKLQDLTEDSELWATLYIKNAAGESLLWAYGDQPNYQGPSYRFKNLADDSDSKLAAYASTLPLSPDPAKLGPILDGVINRRNSAVHFRNVEGLEQAVKVVEGLLSRRPVLRKRCQYEVMVIESFDQLKAAFNL